MSLFLLKPSKPFTVSYWIMKCLTTVTHHPLPTVRNINLRERKKASRRSHARQRTLKFQLYSAVERKTDTSDRSKQLGKTTKEQKDKRHFESETMAALLQKRLAAVAAVLSVKDSIVKFKV